MALKQDELTQEQRYDLLLHIVRESSLSKSEKLKGIKELFPSFDAKGATPYVAFITDYVLEEYAYARSLGLSVTHSAYSAHVSSTILHEALQGIKVSLDVFVKLAEAELYGQAEMKRKHLAKLDVSSEEGNYKSTIAFLEKIYPKEYGQKASLDISAGEDFKKMWQIEVTHVKPANKNAKTNNN